MALYRCAVCGSSRVVPETRQEGYNKKHGILGMALFGLGGAVAGVGGNEVVYYHCADCGHTLNRCMSEVDKKFIDEYLREPTKFGNDMLRRYKKQYPNIEWEEPKEDTSEILRQESLRKERLERIRKMNSEEHNQRMGKIQQLQKNNAEELEKIRQQNIPADIAILNALYNLEKPLTILDMMEREPSCMIYTNQKLSSTARVLCEKKIIERVEENLKAYFRAIPSSKDEAIKML